MKNITVSFQQKFTIYDRSIILEVKSSWKNRWRKKVITFLHCCRSEKSTLRVPFAFQTMSELQVWHIRYLICVHLLNKYNNFCTVLVSLCNYGFENKNNINDLLNFSVTKRKFMLHVKNEFEKKLYQKWSRKCSASGLLANLKCVELH